MKKLFLLGPLLALAAPAAAQHTELSGRAGLGLFRFGGPDAVRTSFVNYSNLSGEQRGYTNSPYGGRLGTGFALSVRGQHVSSGGWLTALDLGYDWSRSRTAINQLYAEQPMYSSFRGAYSADGTTHLRSQNLTAFVGLGHRFTLAAVELDVLAGPEAAYVFGFQEKGHGTYDGNTGNISWATNEADRAANRGDARLRGDLTVWRQQLGLTASYSHGFLNYQGGLIGADRAVYSRTVRLGLAYRLR